MVVELVFELIIIGDCQRISRKPGNSPLTYDPETLDGRDARKGGIHLSTRKAVGDVDLDGMEGEALTLMDSDCPGQFQGHLFSESQDPAIVTWMRDLPRR